MKLRGIDFGNVWNGSGALGFFNQDEYWYQKFLKFFWLLNCEGIMFVSKTTTFRSNRGNMALTKDYAPAHWLPDCIKFQVASGNGLNAVGLSNPGLMSLMCTTNWQHYQKPFLISIMSLEATPEKRLNEFRRMADILGGYKSGFSAPFGVQPNLSCPNSGENPAEVIKESANILEALSSIGVPLVPKYSIASAPIQAIMELDANPHCDAVCASNTLPFGWEGIDWKAVWGSDISPLAHLKGGGLSGPSLRPLVCQWISELRGAGFKKPINGGGGIFCKADVDEYRRAGASSIFLSSVIALRPWRVKGIVRHANSLDWQPRPIKGVAC